MDTTPSTLYVESWLTGPLSTSFYTRIYAPPSSSPRGALVFVHGYIEHIGRYEDVHIAWATRGIAVFAFDQRGFGRTALDELRSQNSAYGKTGTPDMMLDMEWAIRVACERFPGVPLFLMGHSMGGGIVLSFATQTQSPPDKDSRLFLSGVIASSPFVHLTHPPPLSIQWLLGKLCKVLPNARISSPPQVKVLSRNPKVEEDTLRDPWIKGFGTFRGIYDMFARGDKLMTEGYRCWPKNLPLLVLHGTEDEVNSCPATESFHKILQSSDKTLILYPGAWHDLVSEPDGVKEKYMEDCLFWIEAHLPNVAT